MGAAAEANGGERWWHEWRQVAVIRHPLRPNTGMVASWGILNMVDLLGKEVCASSHCA